MPEAKSQARMGIKIGKNVLLRGEQINIGPDTEIGDLTKIGNQSELWGCKIGRCCNIQAFAYIPANIEIGNDVFIGPRVTFTNDKYPPSHGSWRSRPKTIVEDEVMIGAGSVILPGIKLGKGCKIGAGSIVTKDVSEGKTVKGNPAR